MHQLSICCVGAWPVNLVVVYDRYDSARRSWLAAVRQHGRLRTAGAAVSCLYHIMTGILAFVAMYVRINA